MISKTYNLPTPAVLVDGNRLQKNIEGMAKVARDNNVNLRPHVKAHKTAEIARMQMQQGAVGVTVSTLKEARVMIDAGISDITIGMPLWGKQKIELACRMARKARIILLVNNPEHALHLEQYLAREALSLEVLLKIDTGLGRCGLTPEQVTSEVVGNIQDCAHLLWRGWFTHAGHSYGADSYEEITRIARDEGGRLAALYNYYGPVKAIVSVGSTPTAKTAAKVQEVTEIRPGNYVFNDRMQYFLGVASFSELAMTVLSQVIDADSGKVILDAGAKTLALDSGVHGRSLLRGYGDVLGSELHIERLSEEHGIIKGNDNLKGGDLVEIVPNHACPVVNLAEYIYIRDGEDVLDCYPVLARGH